MTLTAACQSSTQYVHDICLTREVRIQNAYCLTDQEKRNIVYNKKLRKELCQ